MRLWVESGINHGRPGSQGHQVNYFESSGFRPGRARAWITGKQIEASRVAMTRFVKRGGKIWIRVFPDKPITKKPAETRMGKGKGAPEGWVAVVRPGKILYEMEGVPEDQAQEAMRLAGHKLSVKSKFVKRFGKGE